MKKIFTKGNLKTAFLFIFLAFCYIPFSLRSGTPQPGKAPWVAKQLNNELKEQRNRTSKHFKKSDGSISAFIAPVSLHYKAANQWQDIVTDIAANTGNNNSTHPYAAEKNSVKTYFPSNPFSNYILMSAAEGSFKEKVSQICFMDAANNMISALPLSSGVSNVVDGNTITYSGFYPGLSLVYSLRNDSRKFDLLINSPSFLSAIPAGAHHLAVIEEFVSDNMASVTKKESGIFVSINNTDVLMFSQPLAFDQNTTNDTHVEGTITAKVINSGYSLQSNFPVSWIQSSQRVFPIHLDPTINYYPTNATNWTGYTTSTTKTSGFLRMLDATVASYAKFNIPSIPGGATFQTANYWGNYYTSSLGLKTVNIRNLAAVDPVTTAAGALFTQATTGPSYNNNYSFGTAAYGWNMGALGGTAITDISNSLSQGWFGLGFSWVSGNTVYEYQYGINGTSAQICYLEVIYTLPPCSGQPTANSVVSPNYAVCNSANVPLSLLNTYTVSGINYQWQSSTSTPVGPWTPIPNATLTTFVTPTTNINIYYSVQITCSTGGTLDATSGYVQIESTITNTAPYFEGFEGINNLNQLPNCSWSSSGGNSQTYTATTTGNRVARTGSKFGAFAAGTATNYFYTNGIQLNAGVTYSASMWYLTEATGLINFTDLSMFIGSTQTTVNALPVASTNGPAAASSYQQLSNTFTVTSSGLYYLAIRGTSNGGSYYLSFDDISITIPCALNSPTVAVSGPTTACAGNTITLTASGANSYTWNTGNTTAVLNSVPSAITSGYTVTATNTLSGCSASVVKPLVVRTSPQISIFTPNPDNSVCPGNSISLYALPSTNNYIWSTTGTPGANTSISPTATAVYSVSGTNIFSCTATQTIEITVETSPVITVSSTKGNLMCVGETVLLSANGADTYVWTSNSNYVIGSSVYITPPAGQITYVVAGTELLTGCTSTASISHNVQACTGLNTLSATGGISVYPNPNNGMFTIASNNGDVKTIQVTDVTGRVLLSEVSSDEAVNLSINGFADGVYYVKVQSAGKADVIKIVKQ